MLIVLVESSDEDSQPASILNVLVSVDLEPDGTVTLMVSVDGTQLFVLSIVMVLVSVDLELQGTVTLMVSVDAAHLLLLLSSIVIVLVAQDPLGTVTVNVSVDVQVFVLSVHVLGAQLLLVLQVLVDSQ